MKPLFIVGGGPSLDDFNFSELRDQRVWAVNSAVVDCPFAELVYWGDLRVYQKSREAFNNFKGKKLLGMFEYKYAQAKKGKTLFDEHPSGTEFYILTGYGGFEEREGFGRSGNLSGYTALHRAIQMGITPIALLGYDMRSTRDHSNYHNRNPRIIRDEMYQSKLMHYWSGLVQPAETRGISIYNLCPDSRLDYWPKMSFTQFKREVLANEESSDIHSEPSAVSL